MKKTKDLSDEDEYSADDPEEVEGVSEDEWTPEPGAEVSHAQILLVDCSMYRLSNQFSIQSHYVSTYVYRTRSQNPPSPIIILSIDCNEHRQWLL